jgi:dCTP deaminase
MILCDREIELAVSKGLLVITPKPGPESYDSTAIDLRLSGTLDRWEFPRHIESLGQKAPVFCPGKRGFVFAELEKNFTKPVDISINPYELSSSSPHNFILGWTEERIYLPHQSRLCARVEGKSSLGRMGLGVHVTAPTIHAGFGHNSLSPESSGAQLRLEIWNVGPLAIELVKGMRICQLILEEVREVPREGYKGQFNLQGPRPAS